MTDVDRDVRGRARSCATERTAHRRRRALPRAGAVLRLPEGAPSPDDVDEVVTEDETMIINMGPQHPSTHGVLRLMLELDGETVLRTKPIIGYLHTGMEKTGEDLTYMQGATNVTRMDYLSPLLQRAGVLAGRREAARHRGAAPGHVDPHAACASSTA